MNITTLHCSAMSKLQETKGQYSNTSINGAIPTDKACVSLLAILKTFIQWCFYLLSLLAFEVILLPENRSQLEQAERKCLREHLGHYLFNSKILSLTAYESCREVFCWVGFLVVFFFFTQESISVSYISYIFKKYKVFYIYIHTHIYRYTHTRTYVQYSRPVTSEK